MSELVWTEKDFGQMSWHDNHVHAMRFIEGESGSGSLVLDIDHIIKWCTCKDGFTFWVVRAELTFREVFGLRVSLDYATPAAALGPFSIASIELEQKQKERHVEKIWRILVNWPIGKIEFEAAGYNQRGLSEPVLTENQWLTAEQRTTSALQK